MNQLTIVVNPQLRQGRRALVLDAIYEAAHALVNFPFIPSMEARVTLTNGLYCQRTRHKEDFRRLNQPATEEVIESQRQLNGAQAYSEARGRAYQRL